MRFSVEKRSLFAFRWLSSAEPDRGHAGAHGHALGLEQLVQALAVEVRAGEHHLRADHACSEYGRPQALTWNIGTTGSTTSRADRFSVSGSAAA